MVEVAAEAAVAEVLVPDRDRVGPICGGAGGRRVGRGVFRAADRAPVGVVLDLPVPVGDPVKAGVEVLTVAAYGVASGVWVNRAEKLLEVIVNQVVPAAVDQLGGRAAVHQEGVAGVRVVPLQAEVEVAGEDLVLQVLRVLVLGIRVLDLEVDLRPLRPQSRRPGVVNTRLAVAHADGDGDRLAGRDAGAGRATRRVGDVDDLVAAVRQQRRRVQVDHLGDEDARILRPHRPGPGQLAALRHREGRL